MQLYNGGGGAGGEGGIMQKMVEKEKPRKAEIEQDKHNMKKAIRLGPEKWKL